jgi:hypothetical protein
MTAAARATGTSLADLDQSGLSIAANALVDLAD